MHWPEVTGAKQELGLVQLRLCSTEAFWIKLLPQWLLRGHGVFIRWMGICIYASSPLSPWDKAQPCCPGTQQDRPRASRLACCAESAQREQRAKKCSERPMLSGAFNGNMNGLRKFSPGCFLFCPHKRLSPMHSGRPLLHSLQSQRSCLHLNDTRGRVANAISGLVKLMASQKRRETMNNLCCFHTTIDFQKYSKNVFYFLNGLWSSGRCMSMQR